MSDDKTTISLPRDKLEGGLNESWLAGYDACIRSLLEIASECNDAGLRLTIRTLAECLKETRP